MTRNAPLPYKLGITGTIASGKSLVGSVFAKAGVPVLDTDRVVADLYAHDQALIRQLVTAFGPAIRTRDGTVDKQALGRLVFSDESKRRHLEALVHPAVQTATRAFLDTHRQQGTPIVAVLVPLLFEADLAGMYDEVWAVVVTPEARLLERLTQRDALSQEAARQRLALQWSQADKARSAQRVIDNSDTPEDTRRQVLQALADSARRQNEESRSTEP